MKVLIQSDELAKDVAGAESLLERHQEHKVKHPFLIILQPGIFMIKLMAKGKVKMNF